MRNGKIAIFLLTLLFVLWAGAVWTLEPEAQTMPIALTVNAAGDAKTITCWKDGAGEYYLFLPSYAENAALRLQVLAEDVRIDGEAVTDGMDLEALEPDTPHAFSFSSQDGPVETSLTVIRSQNLPTLYIDTGSGSMDYIHGKKGNQEAGRLCLYTPEGETACIGDLEAINGRGNDWIIAKKSYSLQLSHAADLLGMGQAEKWILVSNAFDASHLRNKLVYDFAGAMGLDFSPESRWVDLYLNGEYAGLYLLCERNELHRQRVSLEGEGQYLVSMDTQWRLEENARPFVTLDSGYAFRIHGSQLGDGTLRQLLQSVENALCGEDGRDPVTGKHWEELIDLDSWARKYLVEEVFGNGDGGAISQYFYGTGPEGPLYAGPVWDFDVSMGNSLGKRGGEPQNIFASRLRVRSNISCSWFYELYGQEAFREKMTQIYREECLPLLETFLGAYLDDSAALLEKSGAMNQIRWGSPDMETVSLWEETGNIRSFMEQRIDFLNRLWLEQETFYRVLVDSNDGHGTICFAVEPGGQIPYLPEYTPAPEILGWYAEGEDAPFDITHPVSRDMEIILRRAEPEHLSEDSADGEGGRKIPLKSLPFGALVVILALLGLIDVRKRKTSTQVGEKSD